MMIVKKLPIKLMLIIVGVCTFSCSPYPDLTYLKTMEAMEYPFETKKIQLKDGIEVAYFDEGNGKETILFIHGLGSYAPAWKKNIRDLSKNYRCIAIDLPGYGKSSKGNYSGDMTFFAAVVKDFIAELNLQKVTIAGHSMGGQIAITTAFFYPQIVNKLILIAPAGFETFDPGETEWFRGVFSPQAIKAVSPEQIELNFAYNFYDIPSDADFMIKDRIAIRSAEDFSGYCYIIPQSVMGMVNQPVFDMLKNILQPTLILFGENDNLIPNRYLNGGKTEVIAQAGHMQMPNSELKMIDKAGHFVMFEQSEKVNQAIEEFMQ